MPQIQKLFLYRLPTTFFGWFDLVPEDHTELTVFDCTCDEDFAFFFEFFDGLWGFFPGFFEGADGDAAAFAGLALDFGEEGCFVAEIEFVLWERGKLERVSGGGVGLLCRSKDRFWGRIGLYHVRGIFRGGWGRCRGVCL